MRMQPLLLKLLLVFALLFAQLGGLTHGITHVLTEQSQSGDQSPAYDKHCDLCDAYAQISSAIGSSIVSFTQSQNMGGVEQNYTYPFFSVASVPFAARAPPYSA
ncbi:MAG: hypothetical protein KGL01_07010 [Betaproteobacteria bacterium]|nr:hypothetical protein [Betaproteobacteria bacterium]